jgi:CTP synthase
VRIRSEARTKPKFIFVTGGVMSGLGKGVITSSAAKLLQLLGLKVSCVKIDPYVNYDAGTMNPIAHGEVFVTDDGGECDMDIGNYERFLDVSMTESHNITTGRIYSEVIKAEREGKYLGQCVQIIPHITDTIKQKLRNLAKDRDVLVVECGGTVGDIESLPFLEALRQLQLECGESDTLFIHVTLAPILDVVGEQKTKPTQHSVQELRRIGIQPYILAVRCKNPLNHEAKHKISLFASVREECVISCHDAPSIYHVPEILERQGIVKVISLKLGLKNSKVRWDNWKNVTRAYISPKGSVKIGVVGKYVDLPDSYVSVYQALLHASAKLYRRLSVEWIESKLFEGSENKTKLIKNFDGILVPGGFGIRGSEGIMEATNFVRKQNIPFLGICFGFQLALLEFARNQCDLPDATSEEFDAISHTSVIKFMPEQKDISSLGGSMRLGKHRISIIPQTQASKIYGRNIIDRRHRHRYEFNQDYRKLLEENGMVLSGHSDYGRRIEILEIPKHRFFLGVQFHSEFASRPGKPEESFFAFVRACANA